MRHINGWQAWIPVFITFLLIGCNSSISTNPPAIRNDLEGSLQGQVDFAQTHVVASTRRIFDPFLVPNREALVMFTPAERVSGVTLFITVAGIPLPFPMAPPAELPKSAVYDVSNTFSGETIKGEYPLYRNNTYTYRIPWSLFSPQLKLSFREKDGSGRSGTLPPERFVFMKNESKGFVLVNIEGCLFKELAACNVKLDQYSPSESPQLAKIAAREMFSELPVERLHLGFGKAYWPNIIAVGPDKKPHVYTKDSAKEWAEFGDKTLPAKAGMGNYWRAASGLGGKSEGEYVAISGQLLDVPEGIPTFPPGVGASCGGSSCNYPNRPVGYWHETGHGLGLPHDTPGRYEDWAYRSYDNLFLPNTHPDPVKEGLPVDRLGKRYFGHILGYLDTPKWATGGASAPLIEEFEKLRQSNPTETAQWLHYLAPFSHQQMLRVQQRFGSFPGGIPYADLNDDHRPLGEKETNTPSSISRQAGKNAFPEMPLPDNGAIASTEALSESQKFVTSTPMTDVGVPVHTLVATFSDPSHNSDGINQIYPAIISNYGNVYAPASLSLSSEKNYSKTQATKSKKNNTSSMLVTAHGKCITQSGTQLAEGDCNSSQAQWQLRTLSPTTGEESGKPVLALVGANGKCLSHRLTFSLCLTTLSTMRWRGRVDLSNNSEILRLQESITGKFITPDSHGGFYLESSQGGIQNIFTIPSGTTLPLHEYTLRITYQNGTSENRLLFKGMIVKDELTSIAVNIKSEKNPTSATLRVDGVSVFTRALEKNTLPPVISIGAEYGYPGF